MAKELDKQTLTRLAWLTELRRQGHRQCVGVTSVEHVDGRKSVCALMLLATITGLEDHTLNGDVAASAGLSRTQGSIVIMLNDGRRAFFDWLLPNQFDQRRHTFTEIADVVEAWFK